MSQYHQKQTKDLKYHQNTQRVKSNYLMQHWGNIKKEYQLRFFIVTMRRVAIIFLRLGVVKKFM